MVLHLEGKSIGVCLVFGSGVRAVPTRATAENGVVLNEDAIVEDGESGATGDLSFLIEEGAMENDVVSLPLTRFAGGVDERLLPAVERSGLSVGIGLVLKAIKDLNFVVSHEKDSAVSPALPLALDGGGRGPFDVKLAGAELLFGLHVSGSANRFHRAIDDLPFAGAALSIGPVFLEALGGAIEENNGIRWCVRCGLPGGDDRGEGLFGGIGLVDLDTIDIHVGGFATLGVLFDLDGDFRLGHVFLGKHGKSEDKSEE